MNINNISTNYKSNINPTQIEKDNSETNQGKKVEDAVVFERTNKKANYKPDFDTINRLKEETERQNKALQDLVKKLFTKQGEVYNKYEGYFSKQDMINIINSGNVDDETIRKAQEDIGIDGYYGVNKTSERIIDFAKALSGGDPSKIDLLKNAVIKGFEKAESMWGGKLPEISKQTYEKVMAEFDAWENAAYGEVSEIAE